MRLKSPMDDGSFLRDIIMAALIETGVSVKKIDHCTYEVTGDDGTPEVYDLPVVVGYRMIQTLVQKYGLSIESIMRPSNKLN